MVARRRPAPARPARAGPGRGRRRDDRRGRTRIRRAAAPGRSRSPGCSDSSRRIAGNMNRRGGASSNRATPSVAGGPPARCSVAMALDDPHPASPECQLADHAESSSGGRCKRHSFTADGTRLTLQPAAQPRAAATGEGTLTATDTPTEEAVVHVLWINAGLSCDGDSVALTAATQPSIEEIALGALPGLPEDRGALAADRLRVRPGGRRRRLHRVVLQGRSGRARSLRARRRGVHPERGHQEGGLLVRFREQPRDRPAHDHE